VSHNIFFQQVRKVVAVSRHPQTMAPCQRLHHHALCSRYLLSHAGIYTKIYVYEVYMYIPIDTYITRYTYRHSYTYPNLCVCVTHYRSRCLLSDAGIYNRRYVYAVHMQIAIQICRNMRYIYIHSYTIFR